MQNFTHIKQKRKYSSFTSKEDIFFGLDPKGGRVVRKVRE